MIMYQITKKLNMLLEFIQSDFRLLLAWLGSSIVIVFNKLGFNILDYELWKIMIVDILTVILLIVTIGYTITKWKKLNKNKKKK